MLSENLKTLRKAKGLSQEELAIRLNVVRQTVSKWEKGLSVPDADLLTKLADIFEVTVGSLLGAGVQLEDATEMSAIAEQLSRINEHLAVRNRRTKTIWKVVAIVVAAIFLINILLVAVGVVAFRAFESTEIKAETVNVVERVSTMDFDKWLPGEPYDSWFLEDMQQSIRNYEELYGDLPSGVILPQIKSLDDVYSVPCNMMGAYYFVAKCGGSAGKEICFSFYINPSTEGGHSRDSYKLASVELQDLWYFSD